MISVDGQRFHIGGYDLLPIPEDGDAIANLFDFLQLMGDENDGHAFALQLPHHGKQFFRFFLAEGSGRFIKDKQRCFYS